MNTDLSVVIPVRNEAPGLEELCEELTRVLSAAGRPYEIIVVDDGSTDGSFEILKRLQRADPRLRVIRFRRNFGQTAAFTAGFDYARGRIIVTSDGDLQNDPRDIPGLVETLERGADIVCGWRKDRKDAFFSQAPAVDDCQLVDLDRDRRTPARLRMLAQSVSRRGRQAAQALRRNAPVPPGHCERARRRHRGARRQSPAAQARAVEVRDLTHGQSDPRSLDGQVPAELFDASSPNLRPDWLRDGNVGRRRDRMAGVREADRRVKRLAIARCCFSASCSFRRVFNS